MTLFFPFSVQELLLEALVTEIRTASSSASVYPTAATVNARLLSVSAAVMKTSESGASEKLQQKMMLPVRKPAKGMAMVVAHQYLKRVFGHLNGSLTSVAVSTFVKHIHELKGMGTWSSPSTSSTRRVLKLSGDECVELLRDDAFITDAYGRLAMLDALAKVIDEVAGTSSMVTWSGPNKASRVIRCLYGHFANVSFRVSMCGLCFTSRCRGWSPKNWCRCAPVLVCSGQVFSVGREQADSKSACQLLTLFLTSACLSRRDGAPFLFLIGLFSIFCSRYGFEGALLPAYARRYAAGHGGEWNPQPRPPISL